VQFGDGKLRPADPAVQFYLEQKPDIAFGEGGEKMWREIYLTPQQNLDIAKAELADTAATRFARVTSSWHKSKRIRKPASKLASNGNLL
jgi:hypothetical protein